MINKINLDCSVLPKKTFQLWFYIDLNTIGLKLFQIFRRLIQSHPQRGTASPHPLKKYNQTPFFGAGINCFFKFNAGRISYAKHKSYIPFILNSLN